ncbi:MAG: hypothetical protein QF807_05940 [Candidatus Thalassarchaeaceae archaeon]|nr:hypothetical protein [Candidatus Thalassarchaeaceae archaeon]MDP7043540.1 hypothetical protein [Candidatus Thalassarchaeaceae archaeon]
MRMLALAAILISGLIAGVAAILVTVSIERWGGLHGGVLATVPSTIVPAAVGIWLAIGSQSEFRAAMGIVPIGLILNAGFLYLWRVIPPLIPEWRFGFRLTVITIATLATWGAAAAVSMISFSYLTSLGIDPFSIGVVALFFGLVIGFIATMKHRPTPRGENKVGLFTLFMRGLAASASIGIAVWLSSLGNPLASGVMSIFPAIFTTSMVALWLSQGEAVPAGAIGPMMFGSQSVSLYALLVALLYPRFDSLIGLGICSVIAWIASVLSINITVWFYLKSKANSE